MSLGRRTGLEQDALGAEERLGRLRSGAGPLDEEPLQRAAQEDPLDARVVVFDERFDEQPRSLHIESQVPLVGVVPRQAVGVEADEAGARHRRAGQGGHEEEEIRVVAGAMGHVLRELTAVTNGQIADDERGTSALRGHRRRRALEARDEARRRPVAIVASQPADPPRVARELGPLGEHATVRHSNRPAEAGSERRGGARARTERGDDEEKKRGREPRRDGHYPLSSYQDRAARATSATQREGKGTRDEETRGRRGGGAMPEGPGSERRPRVASRH